MGFRVSYRLSLIVAIPALVVGTGALITAKTFFTTQQVVGDLTRDLFREVSQQTVDKARSHLARAIPVADLLPQLGQSQAVATDDQLAAILLPVLRAFRDFSWVSYSDENGRFVGAARQSDGTLRLNRSHIIAGKTVLNEDAIAADGTRTPRRYQADTGYDPRQRPFYQRAKESGARAWTDPYVFFDSGVPGISCAVPARGADGKLAGVFSVDFDLNGLSEFVAAIRLSPSSRVFVFTPEGQLLAHPAVRATAKEGSRANGELRTIAQTDDTAAQQLVKQLDLIALGRSAQTKSVTFRDNGLVYLGSVTSFAIEPGSPRHWLVGVYALESDFQGGVEKSLLYALGVSLLAVGVAVVLGMLLAGRVSRPLLHLAKEMEKSGRLDVDPIESDAAPPSVFEEIHAMNTALQKMNGGLRSFASYVPRDLVRALVASGKEAKLGGETQTLTVFFSDLAGFTTLSESLTPDELVRKLGRYFEEMTQTIAGGGGTVDKFIGDGIMALFGMKSNPVSGSRQALAAAARMSARIDGLNAAFAHELPEKLKIGIGIHSGMAVLGEMGWGTAKGLTAIGDCVNTASRLESMTKEYGAELIVSEDVERNCGLDLSPWPSHEITVRGRTTPLIIRSFPRARELTNAVSLVKAARAVPQEDAA